MGKNCIWVFSRGEDSLSRASPQLQLFSALAPGWAFPNLPPADAGLIGTQISKAGVPVPPAVTCPGKHSIFMLHKHLVSLPRKPLRPQALALRVTVLNAYFKLTTQADQKSQNEESG